MAGTIVFDDFDDDEEPDNSVDREIEGAVAEGAVAEGAVAEGAVAEGAVAEGAEEEVIEEEAGIGEAEEEKERHKPKHRKVARNESEGEGRTQHRGRQNVRDRVTDILLDEVTDKLRERKQHRSRASEIKRSDKVPEGTLLILKSQIFVDMRDAFLAAIKQMDHASFGDGVELIRMWAVDTDRQRVSIASHLLTMLKDIRSPENRADGWAKKNYGIKDKHWKDAKKKWRAFYNR